MQSLQLIVNMEKYLFWSFEDTQLYLMKRATISQFRYMQLKISAKGITDVDRRTLSNVCDYLNDK